MEKTKGPIGIFDSGYGGLTILKEIRSVLPQYNYVYLGDNARTPYGTRSFDVVYRYTEQAVKKLFELGCPLVVLACNTASAKALRTNSADRSTSFRQQPESVGSHPSQCRSFGGLYPQQACRDHGHQRNGRF